MHPNEQQNEQRDYYKIVKGELQSITQKEAFKL